MFQVMISTILVLWYVPVLLFAFFPLSVNIGPVHSSTNLSMSLLPSLVKEFSVNQRKFHVVAVIIFLVVSLELHTAMDPFGFSLMFTVMLVVLVSMFSLNISRESAGRNVPSLLFSLLPFSLYIGPAHSSSSAVAHASLFPSLVEEFSVHQGEFHGV